MSFDPRSIRRRRLLGTAAALLAAIAMVACSGSGADGTATPSSTTAGGGVTTMATTTPTVDGSTAPVSTDPSTSSPGTSVEASTTTAAPPATATGATVPVATVAPQPPTPLGTPGSDADGLQFAITSITAVDGEASGPGEIGGPALQVTVTATNRSSAPADLSFALVDLRYGAEQAPAAPLSIGTTPFAGSVAPGASATAVYVFAVPLDQRAVVRIYVSARPDLPAVVFEGAVT